MPSPHNWHKSSYSGDRNNCVEVADLPGGAGAALRDSTHPHHTHITFDTTEWRAFLTSVRHDEL